MVDRKRKGKRRKTRDKLSKKIRERLTITRILKKFNIGDIVHISIEPSFHYGMPHPRFHGLTGRIIGVRGRCYEVEIYDKDKRKILIVHPVHLKEYKPSS